MLNRIDVVVVITLVTTMFASLASAQSADEDVRWVEEHGFDATLFMERCLSVDAYGQQVTSEPLPVGGGWKIECSGYNSTGSSVIEIQGRDNAFYCVLGELDDLDVGGDERLSIRITDAGEHGPAQLEATSREPLNIYTVAAFGGARVWPLWLTAHYDTIDVVRDPLDGRSCAQIFRVD